MARDYYAELGVDPSASTEEIKQAYRTLARKYHPDTNPGRETAARFSAITEAYHTLVDQRRRLTYNQTVLTARQRSEPTAKARTITKSEFRAAIERVIAYTGTASIVAFGAYAFARWLVGAPIVITMQAIGPIVGIGFSIGLMWGVDANFVVGDFVSPGTLWVARLVRFMVWTLGPWYATKILFAQLALAHVGKLGGSLAHSAGLAAVGIGIIIALVATARDH